MKQRLWASLSSVKNSARPADGLAILLLAAISLYLTRPLLQWNSQTLSTDLALSWAWLYWLRESLFTFHQFPTWSPLWMGGMPYFGMVPPAGFLLVLPLYVLTGNAPAAYNIAYILIFMLAGVSMYLYLRHVSRNPLLSFLGSVIYLVLPVHTSAMMCWSLFEISCGYAIAPLVLLFTDRFLERRWGPDLIMLSITLSFVALVQIEHSFLFLFLFYVPYVIFTLFHKKVGLRQLLTFVRQHKVCVLLVILIILIPITFYIPLLAERANFKGLIPQEIEAGLNHYTFKHFSDTFTARAHEFLDTWHRTATEHYSGPIALVILLASMFFLARPKNVPYRAQLAFFLVMAMALLILSMGLSGPLFPVARNVVPFLADMRVPVRFYPFFALCLPILFVLSSLLLIESMHRVPRFSTKAGAFLVRSLLVLLVVIMAVDFAPYFDFYHGRVVDREEFYECRSFLQEEVSQDRIVRGNHARVLIYPKLGSLLDRLGSIDQSDGNQQTIELTQTSIPWDQYEDAVDYYHALFETITETEDTLAFFTDLLAIDYVLVHRNKIPPVQEDEYVDDKLSTLDSYCAGTDPLLRSKGSLDTDYYTVYLYEVITVPGKVKFHPIDSSVFVPSDDPLISAFMFQAYLQLNFDFSAGSFLDRVVAISTDSASVEDSSLALTPPPGIAYDLYRKGSAAPEADAEIGEPALTAKGLSFDVDVGENGILSLTYYYNPWWKVYVDGRESTVLRVNGLFAGTYVSEGQHHIEFLYDYPSPCNLITRLWR
jgi:hypothetical protein